ncbi:MAG: glycerophosphodiester phosphodiesterase [Desulfobacterales bacterium]|nr:glycerophosphodiester phosphodiesterase [Desulfobacterales bacterium]
MKKRRLVWLVVLVLMPFIFLGCDKDLTPENTVIVVSDGVTGEAEGAGEILPNAIVYKVKKSSTHFTKLLSADKVEGVTVVFGLLNPDTGSWDQMGDLFKTGEDGKVTLDGLRKYVAPYLSRAPVTLRLQARAYLSKKVYVKDDLGIVRILSEDEGENPAAIFADHDNTVHATGGLNSIADWIKFLNVTKGDWPYVDDRVKDVLGAHLASGKDLVLITGMSPEIRYLCRQQMINHFETGTSRTIPIIVKKDFPYDNSPEFKAECLKILKSLYGPSNSLAMVGDTVRQDGYGAFSAGVHYVPLNIYYDPAFWLLNTEGKGWIHPDTIAWNWDEVMAKIEEGPVVRENYFMKHHTGFKNIAHRGGAELMPENTIAAYRNSLVSGAHTLEADVHMTKDGVVIVSHDETVDRCTDGTGAIVDKTLAELKALDAGYRFTTDGGKTFPERGKGHQLPTLEEVFSHPDLAGVPMVLEIKQEGEVIVDKVLELIDDYGMQHKLILGGFNQSTLDLIKDKSEALGLDIKTIFDTKGVLEFTFTPTSIMKKPDYQMPADVLCLPKQLMTQAMMAKIRILGMKCYVWTVNSTTEMKRQMNWLKVDGIMTDNPARLHGVITAP